MKSIALAVMLSSHFLVQSQPTQRVPLLREGTKIIEARAQLTQESDLHPIFINIDRGERGGTDSFIVLPNQRLAEMEALTGKVSGSIFRLSGDVFAYGNRNYLLVREAVALVGHADRNHPTVVPIDPNAESLEKEDFDDSVADIVRDLEEATGSLVRSIRRAAEYPIKSDEFLQEGTRIASRRCNLIRNDDGAWIAVFIADSSGLHDPPCTILPGSEFTSLTKWARNNNSSTPVLLTGELMKYHGHRFLVLRGWRTIHETDHLDY